MKIRLLAIVFAALFPVLAFAQIQPSGNFTPGHAIKALNTTGRAAGDAGGANGGPPGVGLTELGITNTGLPLCVNSGPTTLPYYQICMGANSLGGGLIAYEAKNGATQLPLSIDVNGTLYPFPGQSNGNVVGPTTSIINDFACWNNVVGSLLKDCVGVVGPTSSIINEFACWNNTVGSLLKDCAGVAGPTTSTINDFACWNNTVGSLLKDCVGVTGPNSSGTGNLVSFNGTSGSVIKDTGISTNTGLPPATASNITLGTDVESGAFGDYLIMAVSNPPAFAANTIIGETVNNAPGNTATFPAGIVGFGTVPTTGGAGNAAFGMFGLGEIHNTIGGSVAVGAEFTAANFTGHAPDTGLPPDVSIGTTHTVPNGLHVTCDQRGSADCSVGIWVNNTTGVYSDPLFNTAVYLGHYRQYGLVVEAMPSGTQTGITSRTNGNGPAMILTSSAEPSPLNGVFSIYDHTGNPTFAIGFNGEIFFGTTLSTSAATGGSATALPAAPVAYLSMWINGAQRKIPYYDP